MRKVAALIVVPLLLAAAACGGDSADNGSLPEVSGEFGEKPTVTVEGEPDDQLVSEVLSEGDGPAVEEGDLVVADYLGQTWRAKDDGSANIFDNSYDRGSPAGFSLISGRLIDGWVEGLAGKKVGSRVLLVVPPEQGYGEEGNPEAEIRGDDTLIFVVDIVDRFGKDEGASGTAATDLPGGLPSVTGEPNSEPTISFPDGVEVPQSTDATLLIAGDGEPLDLSAVLVTHIVQASYTTKEVNFSSWSEEEGIQQVTLDQLPQIGEVLEGQKAGSRILLRVSAEDTGGEPLALVIDVLGTYGTPSG